MTDVRRRILLAYALAEMSSIQQAMWRLSGQGDSDARTHAMFLQSWLNAAANEWAEATGAQLSHPEQIPGFVRSARDYLTSHRAELDDLLAELREDADVNSE